MMLVKKQILAFYVVVILIANHTAYSQQEHRTRSADSWRLKVELSRQFQTAYDRYGYPKRDANLRLLRSVEEALRRSPNDREFRWMRLALLATLGRLSEAEAMARDFTRDADRAVQAEAWRQLSEILWKQGRYEAAWQALMKSGEVQRRTRVLLALLVLLFLGVVVNRWTGWRLATRAGLTFLLWIWSTVAIVLSAWFVLGAPFATIGNSDMQQLAAYLMHSLGYIGLVVVCHKRKRTVEETTMSVRKMFWFPPVMLSTVVALLCYFGYWIVDASAGGAALRALHHITVPAVLFLIVGVPLLAAGTILWFVQCVYAVIRTELAGRFGAGATILAGAWCLLLFLSFFVDRGVTGMLSATPWLLAMAGSMLVYEVKGALWAVVLYTVLLYMHTIASVIIAAGHVSL